MNELITSTPETIPCVQIQDLSNYLNDISKKLPDLHLSVLPSVISDCATVFMEYKKMKIDEDQFNKKCKIINDYFQNQSQNQRTGMRFSHKEEMARIKAEKSAKLAQTEATKITQLA